MSKPTEPARTDDDLAEWLLKAIECHKPDKQIQSTLTGRFGLPEREARNALESACDGVFGAISGSKKSAPDTKADPIGFATFNLVWRSFNQNSFFDKRRTPSRKWLDWKEQQKYRTPA